jgi:multisubunit Na+/H+ antiporter MnhG subunit
VSLREGVVAVLVTVAVVAQVTCCVCMALVRTPFDRLHFASAATTVAPPLLVVAFLVDESVSSNTITALLVMLFLWLFGPVIVHGTARLALLEEGEQALVEGSEEDPAR